MIVFFSFKARSIELRIHTFPTLDDFPLKMHFWRKDYIKMETAYLQYVAFQDNKNIFMLIS